MTGAKNNFIFVAKKIGKIDVTSYKYTAWEGDRFYYRMKKDLGVNYNDFGFPMFSENCIIGMFEIDLYYRENNLPTAFLFSTNSTSITNLTYANVWGCKIDILCFGICRGTDCG